MSTTTNNSTNAIGPICKLIMFEETYFRGNHVELTDDTGDFNDINFDDAVASLRSTTKAVPSL